MCYRIFLEARQNISTFCTAISRPLSAQHILESELMSSHLSARQLQLTTLCVPGEGSVTEVSANIRTFKERRTGQ